MKSLKSFSAIIIFIRFYILLNGAFNGNCICTEKQCVDRLNYAFMYSNTAQDCVRYTLLTVNRLGRDFLQNSAEMYYLIYLGDNIDLEIIQSPLEFCKKKMHLEGDTSTINLSQPLINMDPNVTIDLNFSLTLYMNQLHVMTKEDLDARMNYLKNLLTGIYSKTHADRIAKCIAAIGKLGIHDYTSKRVIIHYILFNRNNVPNEALNTHLKKYMFEQLNSMLQATIIADDINKWCKSQYGKIDPNADSSTHADPSAGSSTYAGPGASSSGYVGQ